MDTSTFLAGSEAVLTAVVSLLVTGIAFLIGLIMIYSGFAKMVEYSRGNRQGQSTVGPVAINLLIGSMMIQLGRMVDGLIYTIFNEPAQSPNNAMAYIPEPVKSSAMLENLVQAAVLWVWAIGFVAIVRGLVLWNDLANGRNAQPSAGWRGFWHILFGAAAVNLTGVLKLFA